MTQATEAAWEMIFPSYVQNLHDVLTQESLSLEPYLQRAGLSLEFLRSRDGEDAHVAYLQLVSAVQSDHGIPGLGLKTGRRMHLSDHGLLGYAINNCENLLKALDIFCEFAPMLGGYRANYVVEGDQAHLSFNNDYRQLDEETLRFQVEETFTIWQNLAVKWVEPRRWFEQVHVEFSEPAYAELYPEHFGCEVLFEQAHNWILFDRGCLTEPFTGYNEQLFKLSLAQCAELVEGLPSGGGMSGEVRSLLVRCGGRYPTYEEVCGHFHVSPATLRRRLAEEGTNYQQLLKNFRIELACRYLQETTLSVNEIAYLSGYQDPANFNRAFRSVVELSPQQYRAREQQG